MDVDCSSFTYDTPASAGVLSAVSRAQASVVVIVVVVVIVIVIIVVMVSIVSIQHPPGSLISPTICSEMKIIITSKQLVIMTMCRQLSRAGSTL